MALRWRTLAVLVLLAGAAAPARASTLTEVWRSPLGTVRSLSLDPTNGSLWAVTGSGVTHLAADGTILSSTEGFWSPWGVSVNPTDGSCWVVDPVPGEVIKLASDGTELLRVGGFSNPQSLAVSPGDGSCWVTDTYRGRVVHLDAAGREVFNGDFGLWALEVAVCPYDGSCWVGSDGLAHLSADGSTIWQGFGFEEGGALTADPRDGSCWVVWPDPWPGLYHVSANGVTLWQSEGVAYGDVAVNAADGSFWTTRPSLIHWAADGTEIFRRDNPSTGKGIAVDPANGSVWLQNLIHCDENGEEILHLEAPFADPTFVAANPVDGSVWVTDSARGEVVHLDANAQELWRGGGFYVGSISVNPADGSCWLAHSPAGSVSHLSHDGTLLWQGNFANSVALSVNRTDGSCWMADIAAGDIVRLGQDGEELWRGGNFTRAKTVAASSSDGSCWAAGAVSELDHRVVRFSADGSELASAPVYAEALSVDPHDRSCWTASIEEVYHLAADGSILSRTDGFWNAWRVWVDPNDGTCWVSDTTDYPKWRRSHAGLLVHLDRDGSRLEEVGGFASEWTMLSGGESGGLVWAADRSSGQLVLLYRWFSDVDRWHWALQAILACYQAGIVAGYDDGLYHPERPVDRAAMAVYIARALTGGEDNVPDGPAMPTFYDVPTDYWAYDHIEYCYGQTIVQGYTATVYAPTVQVTRDQMAVYIARSIVTPTGEAGLADYVPSDPRNFPDVLPTAWAYKHVEYCVENGVVQGYSDGYYRPLAVVTRDQMAVYVARAFDLISD